MSDATVAYTSYLRLDELLSLQEPVSDGPEHDEVLFIVIHQVYELWFKQMLHEGGELRRRLVAGDGTGSLHTLTRILTILKTVVAQIDVLETMTPRSFLSFRSRLDSASGFQSAQFREFEALLGHRLDETLDQFDGPARERLEAEYARPALWDAFCVYAETEGYTVLGGWRALLDLYTDGGLPAMVAERLVDLDEGLQEWRYRHVKMVERTIGSKRGTGGSTGVGYLRSTLFQPVFPALWAVRSAL